jgi:predicted dehydrogenase
MKAEARFFLDSIINDAEPFVKPEEAKVVTQIIEGVYESAKTGKEVFF